MSNKLKLKRINDLFSKGETCYLGDDEAGKPVCVWIQKNNSLETEESRWDAQTARTDEMLAMADPRHPEIQNAHMIMQDWTDEEMCQAATNQRYDDSLNLALQDVEADPEWKDKLDYLRRQPELLDDAKVDADDPRRVQWTKYNEEYLKLVESLVKERQDKIRAEFVAQDREAVVETFLKVYQDKLAMKRYMMEARVTSMYFALRECDAVLVEDKWTHDKCDHSNRLLENRKELRELPEDVMEKITTCFDNLAVGARNVANFPEHQSS